MPCLLKIPIETKRLKCIAQEKYCEPDFYNHIFYSLKFSIMTINGFTIMFAERLSRTYACQMINSKVTGISKFKRAISILTRLNKQQSGVY